MRDELALGVADDALAVAAELRVVARQQHEAGEHAGAELVEDGAVAPVAVDLPVRRHRTEVHDAGVGPGCLVGATTSRHGGRAYRRPRTLADVTSMCVNLVANARWPISRRDVCVDGRPRREPAGVRGRRHVATHSPGRPPVPDHATEQR